MSTPKPQTTFTKSEAAKWTRKVGEKYGIVIDDDTHEAIFDEVFQEYLKLGVIKHVGGDEYTADSDSPILKLFLFQDNLQNRQEQENNQ